MTIPLEPGGRDGARCGAKKKQSEGFCTQFKGWGTDHPGDGPCKLHGGATRNHRNAAVVRQVEDGARRALADLGVSTPVVNPLLELQQLAGEIIAFKNALQGMVERLNSVRYDGPVGEQIRGEVLVYERSLDRAARILRDITALKIDERIVEIQSRVTEQQGLAIAGVIRAILDDLELTPQQQARVSEVAPRRLRELSGDATGAARKFEEPPRRLTLADFDRELELLRADVARYPDPPRLEVRPEWDGAGGEPGREP
jgi:hypothetical protein